MHGINCVDFQTLYICIVSEMVLTHTAEQYLTNKHISLWTVSEADTSVSHPGFFPRHSREGRTCNPAAESRFSLLLFSK